MSVVSFQDRRNSEIRPHELNTKRKGVISPSPQWNPPFLRLQPHPCDDWPQFSMLVYRKLLTSSMMTGSKLLCLSFENQRTVSNLQLVRGWSLFKFGEFIWNVCWISCLNRVLLPLAWIESFESSKLSVLRTADLEVLKRKGFGTLFNAISKLRVRAGLSLLTLSLKINCTNRCLLTAAWAKLSQPNATWFCDTWDKWISLSTQRKSNNSARRSPY